MMLIVGAELILAMMQDHLHTKKQTSTLLLEWYQQMGIDECLAETPTSWFELSTSYAQQQKAPVQRKKTSAANTFRPQTTESKTPVTKLTPLVSDDGIQFAKESAKEAKSIADLETAIRSFDKCALKTTAKNTCVSRGNPSAKLMLIGEAPGRDEDLQGIPFVGRAGQLLDRMLSSIGLDEKQFYITNIVYWRPPGNRTPTPQEAQLCRPFLERQIELIQPNFILLLGGAAAKNVLDTTSGIMRLRGKWKTLTLGTENFKTMATLHPAYLLRSPAAKKMAWKDLLALKCAMNNQ